MTVYGEVLFLENFITGWVILVITAKIRGCRVNTWRAAAGGVMCGIYAFILFVPLHWLTALSAKLLFSATVVLTVFGRLTSRGFMKTIAVFYIVSFLMGGVTIAVMYMFKIPGITGNGSYVLEGVRFIQIAAGVMLTWYLGSWLAGLLKEKIHRQQVFRDVKVEVGSRCWNLKALIDTGNSLKEPITGSPVAVLSKSASEKITQELDAEEFCRYYLIPYRTVGRTGMMEGLRPDMIMVNGHRMTDVILGFGVYDFKPWRGYEKYDLLLHQQFLEGEEQEYGQEYDNDTEYPGESQGLAAQVNK